MFVKVKECCVPMLTIDGRYENVHIVMPKNAVIDYDKIPIASILDAIDYLSEQKGCYKKED